MENLPALSQSLQGYLRALSWSLSCSSFYELYHWSTSILRSLYADDILLYKAVESPSDVLLFQQDVNLILQWFHDHGLTPNHSNTKLLQVNRSRTVPAVHISIDDYPLSPSKTVRYLGATLSSDLSWSEHIHSVCKTATVTWVLSTKSCIKHHPKFVMQYIAVLSFPNWIIVVLCGIHTTPLIRLHYIKSNHT